MKNKIFLTYYVPKINIQTLKIYFLLIPIPPILKQIASPNSNNIHPLFRHLIYQRKKDNFSASLYQQLHDSFHNPSISFLMNSETVE